MDVTFFETSNHASRKLDLTEAKLKIRKNSFGFIPSRITLPPPRIEESSGTKGYMYIYFLMGESKKQKSYNGKMKVRQLRYKSCREELEKRLER